MVIMGVGQKKIQIQITTKRHNTLDRETYANVSFHLDLKMRSFQLIVERNRSSTKLQDYRI